MERSEAVRALGYAVFLTAVWAIAAWLRPSSTYHLAPILAAGAPPTVARLSGWRASTMEVVVLGVAGAAMTVVVAVLLGAFSLLEGPSLLPFGGPLTESVVFAALGGAACVIGAELLGRREAVNLTQ